MAVIINVADTKNVVAWAVCLLFAVDIAHNKVACFFCVWRLAFAVCCSALAALANVVRFVVVIGSISVVGGFMLHTNIFAIKNGAAAVTPIRTQQQQQQQRQICLANRILYACSFELDFVSTESAATAAAAWQKSRAMARWRGVGAGAGSSTTRWPNAAAVCACAWELAWKNNNASQDCSYNNVGCLKYIKILIFALEVSCIGASVCVGVLASVLENWRRTAGTHLFLLVRLVNKFRDTYQLAYELHALQS